MRHLGDIPFFACQNPKKKLELITSSSRVAHGELSCGQFEMGQSN